MKKQLSLLQEEEIIHQAKSGDIRAFTELVKRYEQTVFGFSFKVCRDRDKAAETLQDTFVNVYRNLKQFTGRSKFSTWLYSIVTNNCLMKRRKRKTDQELISLDELPGTDEEDVHREPAAWDEIPVEKVMTSELREKLDEAIGKLPVDYRIVFVLRDIENQTAEETARILKLSVPAVKSRLRRARIFLREQLEEYMTA